MTDPECRLPQFGDCCCTCAHRIADYSHPWTDGKPASEQRGYICASPMGFTSGWREHGMCEIHTERHARPDEREESAAWDCMYATRRKGGE